jgi:type VI secretion system protein ImpE
MTPQELYQDGRLREAITALGGELKKNPLDAKRRTFLFELLLFAGEYDRAEKQLEVLAGAGVEAAAGTLLYRSALYAERTRRDMFDRGETPKVEPTVAAPGLWNGQPFQTFEDSDPRIGGNLEVYIAGSYTWIPTMYLRRLVLQRPTSLRDLMWIQVRIETTPEFRIQEIGEVLIPAIAPLSFRHPEEQVQLGREAAWEENARHGQIPYGAKLMVIDGVDVPLMEIRSLEWPRAESEADDAAA